ncbi:hypothetical protein COY32_06770 [candidate division WWE3 bacterium CG_4_10_14_0_2_um_filter_41_14]|uniref:Radical SAM core domain-containing protein n=1 Tax=candidate division WWE3 bacterium CG_4_10_14_0_2_um_filter_41_14 TaxID=1975072 RepID=A0A2M7TEV4_UNCKA|nr:MAG: hypothetical protein COY32_06770 [candidate division WWE3 bacterium CG_4_10_14_0_2_um_filter_41_14]
MSSVDLIQPRHNYANPPEVEKYGHIYLPTSLHTAGARLAHAGVDVRVQDENLRPLEINSSNVGVNLLGAPYIPEVIKLQKRIQATTRDDLQFILGGQVMNGISRAQQAQLFGPKSVNGNHDTELAQVFGLSPNALPKPESTSLIPVYEQISDEDMQEYLSREFSLYVSQGCKFACDFCAAVRTFREPATGQITRAKEVYRDLEILEKDLGYLIQRAIGLGLNKLDIYMSNLDVFQSPDQLLDFARVCKGLKQQYPNFQLNLRGLATVDSFLRAKDTKRESIEELAEAGFHTVGFGVDGMTPQVWKAVKKGHNTEEKCIEAIRSAREDFGLSPELLMVFGHYGVDTAESLQAAYAFTQDMVELYRAVPRPHVSKSFIPGNEGWLRPENADAVKLLIENPEAFQSLDFTALPSTLTHPDSEIRELAAKYYLKICSIPGNTTQHVKPITPDMSQQEIGEVKRYNVGRYDR